MTKKQDIKFYETAEFLALQNEWDLKLAKKEPVKDQNGATVWLLDKKGRVVFDKKTGRRIAKTKSMFTDIEHDGITIDLQTGKPVIRRYSETKVHSQEFKTVESQSYFHDDDYQFFQEILRDHAFQDSIEKLIFELFADGLSEYAIEEYLMDYGYKVSQPTIYRIINKIRNKYKLPNGKEK